MRCIFEENGFLATAAVPGDASGNGMLFDADASVDACEAEGRPFGGVLGGDMVFEPSCVLHSG